MHNHHITHHVTVDEQEEQTKMVKIEEEIIKQIRKTHRARVRTTTLRRNTAATDEPDVLSNARKVKWLDRISGLTQRPRNQDHELGVLGTNVAS